MSADNGEPTGDFVATEADMETGPETALAEGGGIPGEAADPISRKLLQAVDLHRTGLFSEAAEIYGRILLDDPECANALYLLGMILHRMNENEKAVKLVAKSIVKVLGAMGDETVERQVRDDVVELTSGFPVPGIDL